MKKLFFLCLLLSLAACGPAVRTEQPTEAAAEQTAPPTAQASTTEPVATADTSVQAEATDTPDLSDVASEEFALPGTTPEEASVIRPQDHALGAEEPLVTIIEYGDFQ